MDLTAIAYAGIVGLVLIALWYVRKGGADSVKAAANKEALDEIVEVARPATVVELDSVRKSFRRD